MSQAALAHDEERHEHLKFGMWLFLASEIMFFGGFISTYLISRLSFPNVVVDAWQEILRHSIPYAATNTAVLIISSLTMALAVAAARAGNRSKCVTFLGVTSALGLVFMVIKFIEYGSKLGHMTDGKLDPITPSTSVLWGFYYMMTGFHGLHVLGGIIALWIFMWLVGKCDGYLGEHKFANVEILGLYWHFVDVVWIFLFPIVYLI